MAESSDFVADDMMRFLLLVLSVTALMWYMVVMGVMGGQEPPTAPQHLRTHRVHLTGLLRVNATAV
jgi:hypothetical protein